MLARMHPGERLQLWCEDEARIGQKGRTCHRWYERGARPPGLADKRFASLYLFAACRFAHHLKCMVRDKIGSMQSRQQLAEWLGGWLLGYVDGSPGTSSEEWKAAHPLEEGRVELDEKEGAPGQYEAKFFLRPHYQLEGLTVALRLVSRVPSQ